MLRHFLHDWWFRLAAALLAGMTVGLVAGEANSSLRSLPWTIFLMSSSAIASAWVLQTAAWARRRITDRQEGLRRLREMGERLAIYDRETGLLAYWYFSLRLNEEVTRCARYGQAFSLLLLEAQPGRWAANDEKALFRTMAESFRGSDLVAHLGNLRFLALMTSTDADGAMVVQQRLEVDERLHDMTVGYATFPADGESCEQLLAAVGASAELADSHRETSSTQKRVTQELNVGGRDQPKTAA